MHECYRVAFNLSCVCMLHFSKLHWLIIKIRKPKETEEKVHVIKVRTGSEDGSYCVFKMCTEQKNSVLIHV